jgi:serine/threonine protein kinase
MAESKKCSQCGAELPSDAPRGQCLKCLLQLGLISSQGSRTEKEETFPAEKPGQRIGRYKLLKQIGEGGCGVVYLAEQEEPVRRHVALKIIKLGMDTRSVIARFEAERQALAMMNHPHIAKVFDAGATDTGRPYFVMELVQGTRITDFCDSQSLSTRQRLDLFIQVCRAVQHAHQKGIIHRDLKPSNILVTEQEGTVTPKIIDFGIAKATTDQRLTDKTLFTAFEQFIGTPAYMSPEQAGFGGLDIDTRSDIYSLGVLLYELLTGKQPFDYDELRRAALDEILRTIREKLPQRPSAKLTTLAAQELGEVAQRRQTDATKLPRILRGDLDWIVMKALEKERTRRYETADSLALDLQRHLKHEPVTARSPSLTYRFRKFIRRNQLAASLSAALFLAIVALATNDIITYRRGMVSLVGSLSKIIADNSAAAVAFGNTQDALDTLASLEFEKDVVGAALYGADGKLFVTYPESRPPSSFPPVLGGNRYYFHGSRLILIRPVMRDKYKLGSLYLEWAITPIYPEFRVHVGIIVLALSISLVSYSLVSKSRRRKLRRPQSR